MPNKSPSKTLEVKRVIQRECSYAFTFNGYYKVVLDAEEIKLLAAQLPAIIEEIENETKTDA